MKSETKTYEDTILDIQYLSQYVDVEDSDQKLLSCLIVNAYMALQYLGAKLPPLDEFVHAGISAGGFSNSGWRHDYIVSVFKEYGFDYSRAECMNDRTVQNFAAALKNNFPVLVSVESVFWDQRFFHGVLLTGVRETAGDELAGFYYHDPARRRPDEGKNLFVPLPLFYTSWRRMAILPTPFLLAPNAAG